MRPADNLKDQWAVARVTWRSRNGGFFMFSGRPAGQAHSLSRDALERMIARGQFAPLETTHAQAQARQ